MAKPPFDIEEEAGLAPAAPGLFDRARHAARHALAQVKRAPAPYWVAGLGAGALAVDYLVERQNSVAFSIYRAVFGHRAPAPVPALPHPAPSHPMAHVTPAPGTLQSMRPPEPSPWPGATAPFLYYPPPLASLPAPASVYAEPYYAAPYYGAAPSFYAVPRRRLPPRWWWRHHHGWR